MSVRAPRSCGSGDDPPGKHALEHPGLAVISTSCQNSFYLVSGQTEEPKHDCAHLARRNSRIR